MTTDISTLALVVGAASSVVIAIIALVTAVIIRNQIREMRHATHATTFKVVYDILQSDTCRAARALVFEELREKPFGKWTIDERKQAEHVCQSYDSVGIMCINQFISIDIVANSWGSSLRDLWTILSPLVMEYRVMRNSNEFWDDFEWLASLSSAAFATPRSNMLVQAK